MCSCAAPFLALGWLRFHLDIGNSPITSLRSGGGKDVSIQAVCDGVGKQEGPVLVVRSGRALGATANLIAVILKGAEARRPLRESVGVGGGSARELRVGRGDGKEAAVSSGVARAGVPIVMEGCGCVSRGPSRTVVYRGAGIGFCHFGASCRSRADGGTGIESQRRRLWRCMVERTRRCEWRWRC